LPARIGQEAPDAGAAPFSGATVERDAIDISSL
jgi:hypothetical protein